MLNVVPFELCWKRRPLSGSSLLGVLYGIMKRDKSHAVHDRIPASDVIAVIAWTFSGILLFVLVKRLFHFLMMIDQAFTL